MNPLIEPSAPPLIPTGVGVSTPPPSYDEAVGNVASGPADPNILNPSQVAGAVRAENEKKEKAPPVTSQPEPQTQTMYNFQQPVNQNSSAIDWCSGCCWCDADTMGDICYSIFCSWRCTAERGGCCESGDTCCSCPEDCCHHCGDCDCGGCDCGDCDCGDCDCGDCDCGDCDCGSCDCDCGDCTIL